MATYPRWAFYPARDKPPEWVLDFVEVVSNARQSIDSAKVPGLTSDIVLARLRPVLEGIGFRVEAGKKATDRITLPVRDWTVDPVPGLRSCATKVALCRAV